MSHARRRARRMRSLVAALFLATLLAPASGAIPALGTGVTGSNAIWYVGPGGGAGPCEYPDYTTGDYASDAAAINTALGTATSGDVVHLCPDTYSIDTSLFVERPLTLEGDGSANTILTGSGTTHVIHVIAASGDAVTLRDLQVRDTTTLGIGPAVYVDAADVTITRARFIGNSAPVGQSGAVHSSAGHLTVSHSLFSGNSAPYSGALGSNGPLTIVDTDFIGNLAQGGSGGAIYAQSGGSISGGNFLDNTAGSDGGAIRTDAFLAVDGSRFERNTGNVGGAINTEDGIALTDATFIANYASIMGGAFRAKRASSIVGSQFTDNTSGENGGNGYGGAVIVEGAVDVSTSSFVGNHGAYIGGGIYADRATITDSTFVGNSTETGYGGGVFLQFATVIGSTFARNTSNGVGANLWVNSLLTSYDSLFVDGDCSGYGGNEAFGANLTTDNTCPGAVVAEADLRLDSAPKANGASTLTLALLTGSFAIDATTATPCSTPTDQRGVVRPTNGGCDAGAYEWDGVSETPTVATQVSANGIDITSGVPTLTTGDLVADLVTVTGTTSDSNGGTFDPTGAISFHYCRDDVAPPTDCTAASWTTIAGGPVSLTSGDAESDGTSVARLVDWAPPQGGYYLLAVTYLPGPGGIYQGVVHTDPVTEAFHMVPYVSLVYAGPFLAVTDGTIRLTLTANASPTGDAEGCPVNFALDPSAGIGPLTGTASGGVATVPVDLSGGVYTVRISVGGDCTGGTDTGVLVVGTPGTKGATGGGWYRVAGFSPPKAHFGFTVQVQRRGLVTTTRGQLLWMARGGGGWRLKASIPATDGTVWVTAPCPAGVGDASSNSSPVCGTFFGQGLLQQWDPDLEDWVPYEAVNWTATIYDGGSTKTCKGRSGKHCTVTDVADWFGLTMTKLDGTPITTADGVPVSAPIRLYVPTGRGSVKAL